MSRRSLALLAESADGERKRRCQVAEHSEAVEPPATAHVERDGDIEADISVGNEKRE